MQVHLGGDVYHIHVEVYRENYYGRWYRDLDTNEVSPFLENHKQLVAWYFNRPIVPIIL